MPSVEISDMVDESKGQHQVDNANGLIENSPNPLSPLDCDEKPTNGADDSVTDENDDDSRYFYYYLISVDRKLFVGGLSWETNENDLKEYFSRWGKVTQCIIKLDRFTGNSRGFGFVTLENEDCVSKVLSVPEHWLKNKKIDPKKAKPSREPLKKIFVGGIDPEVTEDQIREYFSNFGKVESLDLPYDTQKGKRKHYIFVSFSTEAAAKKAISKERQDIFGRQCDVRVAVTRDQANRQKVALKQWYNWLDPSFSYPGYAYGDYANAYPGFDPFTYSYYGYDYYGSAAAAAAATGYGAYTNLAANQFCGVINPNKVNQNIRTPAAAPGAATRMIGSGTTGTIGTNPHQTQSHTHLNYTNLLTSQLDPHHTTMSAGLDFSVAHPQPGQGMVAGSGATRFSHPQ
ncbi:unnamed protein product [Schistosoma margrebowiei]|uniref:Heterogeneous nuclear ribonucleoprotein A/B n=1 Tax=Schistosoma margrebowiei TaxID=48269 RepID=A0AA85AFG5_9TREM|nr:unnamed protein product [Schistosoma margrebowiei]